MDRGRAIGVALIVVSACAFGSGALIAKPIYALGVGWLTLLAWRFTVGAATSWAWLLVTADGRATIRRAAGSATVVALGLGILYVGNSATYYASLETVPASLAGLVVYVYPALVAVLSLRYARALEGRRAWVALGVALAGVALALGGIPATAMPPVSGLALLVASPVIYAVWIVLAARLGGERSTSAERDPAGADTTVSSATMMTATAAVYLVLAAATATPVLPGAVPAAAWPYLLALGLVTTFVAILTFTAGTRRIGAAQAALVSTIEPAYTIVLAGILFGERLTPIQLAGAGLILAAVVLAQASPSAIRAVRPGVRLADE